MKSVVEKVFLLFTPVEKREAFLLLIKMIAMAFLEVIGIASVSPFLAVLGNSNLINENQFLLKAYNYFGFTSQIDFMILLASFAILLLIGSSVFKGYVTYSQFRFSAMRKHSISMFLLKHYVYQPFSFYLKKNSSELAKVIHSEIQVVVSKIVIQLLHFSSYLLVASFVIITLFIVNPILATFVTVGVGGFYVLFYLSVRKMLAKIGVSRVNENNQKFKIVSEVFGGIKELKVLNREEQFIKSFETPSYDSCKHEAIEQGFSLLPRFLVEALGFVVMFLAILFLKKDGQGLGAILPVIGVYGLAGYRLMPALQNMYAASTSIRYGTAALDELLENINEARQSQIQKGVEIEKIQLTRELKLENITFSHEGTTLPTLKKVSLSLPYRSSLGIIGTTGAGKSTLVDVILGLLSPQAGKIIIDGTPLVKDSQIRGWQKNIGYVPQSIYLSDNTLLSNIAFGIDSKEINIDKAKDAAKMAMIHDFIESLPEGYQTVVGERGVRLSGGQRQRIGIARALYSDPDLLIFDEATSALDKNTEVEVMKAIEKVSGSKTIIMIAHRLDTVRKCKKIIKLDLGEIVHEGSAEEVLPV